MEGAAGGQGAQEGGEEGLADWGEAGRWEGFEEVEHALGVCVGSGEEGAERERGEGGVGGGVPLEQEEGGGRGQREREEAGEAARGEGVAGQRGAKAGEVERGEQLRPRCLGGGTDLGWGFPHTGAWQPELRQRRGHAPFARGFVRLIHVTCALSFCPALS